MEIKWLHCTSTTLLDYTDLYAHGEEYVRDNCSQQSEKLLLLLCTARFSVHNLLYVMLSRRIFFFPRQRKINCKEGQEFVFIVAWWSWVPGWRRTAVGEGWPTRCLLPLPCLAAPSLWQNKPPGILGKHWEPLTGIRTISWERHSQKASHFQHCLQLFFFPKLNCCFRRTLLSKIWNSHDQKIACSVSGLQIWARHHLERCWNCKQTCSFHTPK